MTESRYPEQGRRREMLRLIHEWTNQQWEAEPILRYYEFITLVGITQDDLDHNPPEDIDRMAAGHMRRFMNLIDERYINARYKSEYDGGPPFTISWIRGLSERGLQVIEEMPDPQAETMKLLDDIAQAIRTLDDEEAPPEQKKVAERAISELKHFLRGLPPGVATEVGSRIFGA